MPAQDLQQFNAHEQLMQTLSAMLLHITSLQVLTGVGERERDSSPLREGLSTLETMAREMLLDLRAENEDIPLEELEGVPLPAALSRLVEATADELGLSSRSAFSGEERHLPPFLERLLYRIAREALYQARFHQNTRRLRFTLNYERAQISMSIEDDGAPPAPAVEQPASFLTTDVTTFNAAGNRAAFNDLRHRLEHLGGTLEFTTQAEQGTRVHASVPYPESGAASSAPTQQETAPPFPPTTSTPTHAPSKHDEPATPVVRVLIVEGQAVTRAGLHGLLESYAGIHVIGEASDGVQAVSETLELGPDLVLMDAQLPNGQSMEALKQIKQLNLETHVLLLSSHDREEFLYETLRAGADGFILKDILPDELAQAVRSVARGEVLVQPQLAGKLLSRFGKQGRSGYAYDALTPREQEVLRLLARGLRNKEIAARLFVSERTVNFHLANIYQKLNVSGRTEALSKALEQGLISA